MTITDWADLPNAAHIGRVLASVKANPKQWALAWDNTWSAERAAALNASRDAICSQGRLTVWYQVRRDTMETGSPNYTWGVVLALCAFDDCAHMLDSDPGELAILAAFGDPRATMILPACNVFHSPKTQSVT